MMGDRFWPRLCENARDSDANGTAHHFGSASVETGALSPHFGLFPSVKQVAITTDFLNFAFLHSLGRLLPFAVWILNQFERPLLVEAAIQDALIENSPTGWPVSVRKQPPACYD